MSLLGYSCAIHVFDQSDSLVSRFSVEMPYRLQPDEADERLETPSAQEWAVLDLTTETPQGAVRFYRGIVNLEDYVLDDLGFSTTGRRSGKIVVDVPFFFENLAWAARTGPQTPEVLRNVQEGGVAPRLEETEPMLLARVGGTPRARFVRRRCFPSGTPSTRRRSPRAAASRMAASRDERRDVPDPHADDTETPGMSLVAGFAVPSLVPARPSLVDDSLALLFLHRRVSSWCIIVLQEASRPRSRFSRRSRRGGELGFQQKLLGRFFSSRFCPP